MTSHFGAIGLKAGSRQEYGELLRRLYALGRAEPVDGGSMRVVWTGSGGARVELEIDCEGSLTHVLPALVPRGAPVPVRGIALAPDGVAHMELLDGVGGRTLCPLPVELTDRVELRALGRRQGGAPTEGFVRLSALAERIDLYEDRAAYDAAQRGREPAFAPEYLIPSGLFRPDDSGRDWAPAAQALFAGGVVTAERVENEIGGGAFHRLRVRTLGGIEVDVAVSDAQLPHAPAPDGWAGRWVEGAFFMTGSLGLGTPRGAAR
ncbi:hypothetical protein IQ279_02060 [Streptomyces verrucosisporus]|uniref:hypothetical protein n=1 Tax=Streptomyces verrucosisporus TaxID=1695161 RepID=UPI0019D2C4E1|nr:hypothetical protein [Streptomyces verrucosisporus]MBN3928441.1 hypothetical protein [Streptomyces verrucosisporus]